MLHTHMLHAHMLHTHMLHTHSILRIYTLRLGRGMHSGLGCGS